MRGSVTPVTGRDGNAVPGRWRLRVYVGRDHEGRIVQRSANVEGTKREAEEQLRRMLRSVRAGSRPASTVAELLSAWLDQSEGRRAPQTMATYRAKIERRILPAFGRLRLAQLTPAVLDRQYREWEAEGLSPTSVRHLHGIVSAALAQAVKWGWLESSPAQRATPPTVRRSRRAALTIPELQALVRRAEVVDGPGGVLATAIALAAVTGARRGELCALRWSDWDGTEALRIERNLTVLRAVWSEGPTKTHAERTVVLDANGAAVLERRRRAQEMLAEIEVVDLAEDAFILSRDADGARPCLPDGLSHGFASLVRTLWPPAPGEAPRWHFHDLRHFAATVALAAGVDARTVADRLGHADPSMTLRVYAHTLDDTQRALAALMGTVVGALPAPPNA